MANFFAILDPDPERRRRAVRRARPSIAPVPGLDPGEEVAGDFAVVWAAGPHAPVSVDVDDGSCTVVWGEAIEPGTDGRRTAADVRRAWRHLSGNPPSWDGFYAAVSFGDDTGVVAGGDVLGLFPIYHAGSPPVVLLSSTPQMLRWHPLLRPGTDHLGLAGILLTGGAFRGRTPWSGITRLAAGHLLAGGPDGSRREIACSAPSSSAAYARLAFPDQVAALDDALRSAVDRHFCRDPTDASDRVVLLSGGRDSRLLAGTAHGIGSDFSALTFGRETDFEVRCAEAVARRLGVPHRRAAYAPDRYPAWARLHTRWEHLTSSFGALYTWGTHVPLRRVASRVMSGHLLELVLGGIHGGWAGDDGGDRPAEAFLTGMNRHAVPLRTLRRMVRSTELLEAVDEAAEQIRQTYRSYGSDPSRSAQKFLFEHWGRYHPGSVPWRLSFGAWPVLPVLDRQLLTVGVSLPISSVGGRRAEDALLRRCHASFDRLPLDRNSREPRPLEPTPGWRLRSGIRRVGRRFVSSLLPGVGDATPERRFYLRIYDFDGPGWRSIRRRAEPHRRTLDDLFHAGRLASYLPPPNDDIDVRDPIADSFGRKSLLGLMLLRAGIGDGSDGRGE